MAEQTTNFGLKKPVPDDFYNVDDQNGNMDILDTELKKAQDKADQAFQSASNGKSLIKNAITGVDPEVTIPTDATFQQLATAIGQIETGYDTEDATVTAGDILSPKNAYGPEGKITGTMPNRGPSSAEIVNLTTQNQEYVITQGYHSGLRKIKAVISGLVASVIKAGTTVGGIVGTFTADATAVVEHVLAGESFYKNGSKLTGILERKNSDGNGYNNMNSKVASAFIDVNNRRLHFPILPGAYIDNASQPELERDTPMGYIDNTYLHPNYLLSTANIFGMQGAIPIVYADVSGQYPSSDVTVGPNSGDGNNYAYMYVPINGRYNQNVTYFRHYEPDLLAQNIIPGKTIFKIAGNAPVKRYAGNFLISAVAGPSVLFAYGDDSGSVPYPYITVTGLTFKPSQIIILSNGYNPTAVSILDAVTGIPHNPVFRLFAGTNNGANVVARTFKADALNCYVTSTGFQAPVPVGGIGYTWIAFE